MSDTQLKSLTIYLTPEEAAQVAQEADDHGVTISAYVRARTRTSAKVSKVRRVGSGNGGLCVRFARR